VAACNFEISKFEISKLGNSETWKETSLSRSPLSFTRSCKTTNEQKNEQKNERTFIYCTVLRVRTNLERTSNELRTNERRNERTNAETNAGTNERTSLCVCSLSAHVHVHVHVHEKIRMNRCQCRTLIVSAIITMPNLEHSLSGRPPPKIRRGTFIMTPNDLFRSCHRSSVGDCVSE